jgi:Tfp pilus assembly protein PilV
MTLVEVMVSMLIVALTALAVVPMFALAASNNASGADYGVLTGIAMEEMEAQIRADYHHLVDGGSLTENVADYFYSDGEFLVRWQIERTVDPSEAKIVTVRVIGEAAGPLPGREWTLTTLRARP